MLDPLTGGPVVDAGMQTSVPGIFSAGNVVTIYDLVDYVSKAGMLAGRNAALFASGQIPGRAIYWHQTRRRHKDRNPTENRQKFDMSEGLL